MKKLIVAACGFALISTAALAVPPSQGKHHHTPAPVAKASTQASYINNRTLKHNSINARQQKQYARINHGLVTGKLTKAEAQRLKKQQARIAGLEHNFRVDGKFNHKERTIINAKINKASKHIYALKNNERHTH